MENVKTLILNHKENQFSKAVINLKQNENSIIKFYNFDLLKKNLALGIKSQNNIIKIPLSVNENKGKFMLPKSLNLQEKIVCAVVDITNVFCPEIILSGSANNDETNTKIEKAFVVKRPENTEVLYEEETLESIENLVDKNLEDDQNSIYYDSCSNCKYRKAFYDEGVKESENQEKAVGGTRRPLEIKKLNIKETSEKDIENIKKNLYELSESKDNLNEEAKDFYGLIKKQIDTMFEKYSKEPTLERIIPNSKWIKVEYESSGDFYVLGLIYNDEKKVEYISYGLFSKDSKNPPEDLKEFAQWLPLDFNAPDEDGYWIVYQNAENGETVKIDIV